MSGILTFGTTNNWQMECVTTEAKPVQVDFKKNVQAGFCPIAAAVTASR